MTKPRLSRPLRREQRSRARRRLVIRSTRRPYRAFVRLVRELGRRPIRTGWFSLSIWRGDLKRDEGREVRIDGTGDDGDRRPMRGQDEMQARRGGHLWQDAEPRLRLDISSRRPSFRSAIRQRDDE